MKSLFPTANNIGAFDTSNFQSPTSAQPLFDVQRLPTSPAPDLSITPEENTDSMVATVPSAESFDAVVLPPPQVLPPSHPTTTPRNVQAFLDDHIQDAIQCVEFWKKHLNVKDPTQLNALQILMSIQKGLKDADPNDLQKIEQLVELLQEMSMKLTANYISQIDSLNQKLKHSSSNVSSLNIKIAHLKQELDLARSTLDLHDQNSRNQIEVLNRELQSLLDVKRACDVTRNETLTKLEQAEDELARLLESNEGDVVHEAEIEKLTQKISQLEAHISQLESPLLVERNSEQTLEPEQSLTTVATTLNADEEANLKQRLETLVELTTQQIQEQAALEAKNKELEASNKKLKNISMGLGLSTIALGAWLVVKHRK